MSNFSSNISNSDFITIDADAGLEMNYGDQENNSGTIDISKVIKTGFSLHECSSVDGKNIFFPISDYASAGDKEFVNTVNTEDLVFREATANDKNTKYISVDFTLSSESETDVWLSTGSEIYCANSANTAANAIRVAFIERAPGGTATVFDNSKTKDYAANQKHLAVEKISTVGESSTLECTPHAFSEYMYGGKVLFHIDAGETLKATMNIWLEGTDADCTSDVLDISDLQIKIKFSTSYESMRTITFIDQTLEKWVANDECYVYAKDDDGRLHSMTPSSDYTWTVELPGTNKNVEFVRYNPKDPNIKWNYWKAGALGECSTYVAFGHSAGMWSDTFSGTTITLLDGTPNGYLRDNNAEMHLMYSVVDGNGKPQALDYKMSYQNEYYRWQIVIPSNVTDIDFKRMNETETEVFGTSWTNVADRGDNLYYTITTSDSGYWSNQLIYLEDTANIKGSDAVFAAYFYGSGNDMWTGMRAHTSNGRYVAAVPEGKTGVVLTRYKTSATIWDWSNRYNETPDNLKTFGTNNLFKTSAWMNDDGVIYGTWYPTDSSW